MAVQYFVLLSKLAQEQNLTIINASPDYESAKILSTAVARPGLQFAGFYAYYDPLRILVYGKQENTYLEQLPAKNRYESIDGLMRRRPCALVACHDVEIFPEMKELAKKHEVNLFSIPDDTSEFMAGLITSLHVHLAPRQTIHAVLVEAYGEGVLIMGDSGIGKSETALELIKRGHRLIADDAVEIRKVSENRLIGQAPEHIRNFMEIRGVGLIDVRAMFGISSILNTKSIDLNIHMETWNESKAYDRIGDQEDYTTILDVKIPRLVIPVRPGRNLAITLEVAAKNFRLKAMGYNSAQEIGRRVEERITRGSAE